MQQKLLAALAMAREIDNPALLADAALGSRSALPAQHPTRDRSRRARSARIQEVVPAEWKDEFASSPRVIALGELTS